MKTNLLKETLEVLKRNNKQESDVKWVGTRFHKTTWENFKKSADVNYYSGYGSPEVSQSLLVVGDNWWLERHQHDGSEWWEFKQLPIEPTVTVESLTVLDMPPM